MHYDQPGTLVKTTQALITKDPRSTTELSIASTLPFYWLRKFRSGAIRAPNVNRVQFLYEFLTHEKLKVPHV